MGPTVHYPTPEHAGSPTKQRVVCVSNLDEARKLIEQARKQEVAAYVTFNGNVYMSARN